MVQRVGAITPRRIKLQIIAATNRDLLQLVGEGRFRRDLYYRLSVVILVLLPLRQRPELISLLLERFLAAINQRRPQPLKLSIECRRYLETYSYPGNIRELQNIVEHLAVVCEQMATEADLPIFESTAKYPEKESGLYGALDLAAVEGMNLREMVRSFESKVIQTAISKAGSTRKAAERLGVDIATVVRKSKA
jgi:transcriptional regulator with PAS, ATPase and Fis domain